MDYTGIFEEYFSALILFELATVLGLAPLYPRHNVRKENHFNDSA